jgi:hypothetical protein
MNEDRILKVLDMERKGRAWEEINVETWFLDYPHKSGTPKEEVEEVILNG